MRGGWNKGMKFPERQKEKNHNWKGGKNKCLDCSKLLSNRVAKRCRSCNKIGNPGAVNCRGSMRYNWIEDRSKIKRQEERNSPNDKQWKYAVYKRDGFKCKISDENCKGRIEAHHILGWTQYPELRFIINNGITLCHFHHPRKREDEINLSPYFKELVGNVN